MRKDRLTALIACSGVGLCLTVAAVLIDVPGASATVDNADSGPIARPEIPATTTTIPIGFGGPITAGPGAAHRAAVARRAGPTDAKPVNLAWITWTHIQAREAQARVEAARIAATTATTEAATPAPKGN